MPAMPTVGGSAATKLKKKKPTPGGGLGGANSFANYLKVIRKGATNDAVGGGGIAGGGLARTAAAAGPARSGLGSGQMTTHIAPSPPPQPSGGYAVTGGGGVGGSGVARAASATGAQAATSAGQGPDPGSTSAGGNVGPYGTSPLAKAIQDAQFGAAYQNPDQLAALWFNQGGYNPYGGGYATTQEVAQNVPLQYLLASNDQQLLGGYGNYFDYANSYLNRATGPGHVAGATDIFQGIFDPRNSEVSDMLNNPNLNYNDQIQNLVATLGQGLQGALPAPVLKALVDEAQFIGQQWGAEQLKNPMQKTTFAEYFLTHSKMGPSVAGLLGG